MPRPGPRRVNITFVIARETRGWITEQARKRGITDGELVRWMLAYATAHMPEGYRPDGVTPEKRRPGT